VNHRLHVAGRRLVLGVVARTVAPAGDDEQGDQDGDGSRHTFIVRLRGVDSSRYAGCGCLSRPGDWFIFRASESTVKLLIAITGASGTLYAQRLLDHLDPGKHDLHVILSSYAQQVIREELPGGLRLKEGVRQHNLRSMNAPFASGSNPPDAMVIIPCTMGTLGRIAHGYSEDVLLRAADVVLKEKRKLILVPRETPLNLVHVRNFELLLQAGAILLPANPSFYRRPQTVEAVVDTVVGRVLDHLGIANELVERWSEEGE